MTFSANHISSIFFTQFDEFLTENHQFICISRYEERGELYEEDVKNEALCIATKANFAMKKALRVNISPLGLIRNESSTFDRVRHTIKALNRHQDRVAILVDFVGKSLLSAIAMMGLFSIINPHLQAEDLNFQLLPQMFLLLIPSILCIVHLAPSNISLETAKELYSFFSMGGWLGHKIEWVDSHLSSALITQETIANFWIDDHTIEDPITFEAIPLCEVRSPSMLKIGRLIAKFQPVFKFILNTPGARRSGEIRHPFQDRVMTEAETKEFVLQLAGLLNTDPEVIHSCWQFSERDIDWMVNELTQAYPHLQNREALRNRCISQVLLRSFSTLPAYPAVPSLIVK